MGILFKKFTLSLSPAAYARYSRCLEACAAEEREMFDDLLEVDVRDEGEEVPEPDYELLKRRFMAYYFVKLIQDGDYSVVEPGVSEEAYGRFGKRLRGWLADESGLEEC